MEDIIYPKQIFDYQHIEERDQGKN